MSDNKELNDNLERLFSTIKDAYGIASMIEDFKEKEVANKESDYEILSFKPAGCDHIYDAAFLEYVSHGYPIYSVRRKSDSEIFTQKDLTDEGVIKSFYEECGQLWIRTEGKGGTVSINDIQKVPKVFHAVQKRTFDILYDCVHPLDKPDNWEVFDTKEKAMDYKYHNKICLSYNDAVHWLATNGSGYGLYEFVKEKINNNAKD